MRPDYCPCKHEQPDPCPACGATVKGDDKVHGVCQSRYGYREPPLVELVLIDRSVLRTLPDTKEPGNG